MNKLKLTTLFLALACVCGVAYGATLYSHRESLELARGVSRYVTTDTSIALRIKWIASGTGGTITVNAGGDLVFTTDGSTADTTVSTDGTVDVSGATEDTFGEIATVINLSSNWSCALVDVLPTWSGNNTLTAASESTVGDATAEEGIAFTYNTADLDKISISIGPEYTIDEEFQSWNDRLLNRRSYPIRDALAPDWNNELLWARSNIVGGSEEAVTFSAYAVRDDSVTAPILTLWSEDGATSVTYHTFDLVSLGNDGVDNQPIVLPAPTGYRIVLEYSGVTAAVSGSMQVIGRSWNERP